MCSPPQVTFPSITIYPPVLSSICPHPSFPLVITTLLSVSMRVFSSFFCLISSPFFTQSPNSLPSGSCQSVLCIYESVSILFVYFVHNLFLRDQSNAYLHLKNSITVPFIPEKLMLNLYLTTEFLKCYAITSTNYQRSYIHSL